MLLTIVTWKQSWPTSSIWDMEAPLLKSTVPVRLLVEVGVKGWHQGWEVQMRKV